MSYLRQQAKDNIKKYDERLPQEYEKCMVGLTSILKEAWNTAANTENEREKLQALSLAKECYSMKLDLLTNATVVNDAIRFVSQKSQEKVKLPCSGFSDDSTKESNDVKNKDKELEGKQEEQTQEIVVTTIKSSFLRISAPSSADCVYYYAKKADYTLHNLLSTGRISSRRRRSSVGRGNKSGNV
jgi:hypothetical protein